MQTKVIIFSLFLLLTNVLAGGYSGALERVWYWYAYQIDGLNDPADRKLGWECKSWNETTRPQKCNNPPGWAQCRGSLPNNRCRFDELLNKFGGRLLQGESMMADSSGKALALTALNPDPEESAKLVYRRLVQRNDGKVPDVPGYRFNLQGSERYINTIDRISNVVVDTYERGKQTAANKYLFKMFAKTTEQVKISREGDQGRYIIQAAQTSLDKDGIRVATQKVGSGRSPVNLTRLWNTVDWEKTASNAIAAGMTTDKVQQAVVNAKQALRDNGSIRGHMVAMRAFETVERKLAGCI
ncbi:hypothetical protein F4802DRAFT_471745 [Xylaria palmicola]|nr:hypothetical protein F4802DRAFT_471745 [Xylaria palmicola]